MQPAILFRSAALAAVLGAGLQILSLYLQPGGNPPEVFLEPGFVPIAMANFAGGVLLILAMGGLFLRQARASSWLGFAGYLMATAGLVATTAAASANFLVFPDVAQAITTDSAVAAAVDPALRNAILPAIFGSAANLLLIIGLVVLALGTWRAAILSKSAAAVVIVGAPLMIFVRISADLLGLALPGIVQSLTDTVLLTGIIWLGISLWKVGDEWEQTP